MSVTTEFLEESDQTVFTASLLSLLGIIVAIVVWPDAAASKLAAANTFIVANLGWLYLWVVFLSFLFVLYVLLGPWGRIKLGGPDDTPRFSFLQYLIMTFTAGLSSGGLEFWGPVEPLVHYQTPPPFFGASSGTWERMAEALQYAIFHYGTSAWATYLVFAIAISYFVYRRGTSFRPAVILAPFFGADNIDGWMAKLVDTLVVIVTISGITVSFGLGISQFISGLAFKWGVQVGDGGKIVLISLIGIIFLLSVIAGIQQGIRRFADLNVVLLLGLMTVTLAFGPLSFLLNLGTQALKGYIVDYIGMSLFFTPEATSWLGSWTLFFWPWWLTFAPMVGIFMARISRGRTLRQLVFAGLVGSFGLTVPWYVATGGSALWLQSTGMADLLGVYSESGLEAVGFALFEQLLPYPAVFSAILLALVVSFLITTLDSSTLSIAMIIVQGKESPSTLNRVIWGLMMIFLTISLSLAGGLPVLQSFTILVGLPTAILCVITIVGMIIELERHSPVLVGEIMDSEEDSAPTEIRDRLGIQQNTDQSSDD